VLFASTRYAGIGYTLGDYSLAAGVVSLAAVLSVVTLQRFSPPALQRQSPIKYCSSSLQLIYACLILWWLLGAGFLTFRGPFTVASNGFFASWVGLLASCRLFQLTASEGDAISTLSHASHSASAAAVLGICSIAVLLASLPSASSTEGTWGIVCSVVSVVTVVACWVAITTRKARRVASLFLLCLWLAGVGVLTFRGPFIAAGNGFFASWGALVCAIAFAFEES